MRRASRGRITMRAHSATPTQWIVIVALHTRRGWRVDGWVGAERFVGGEGGSGGRGTNRTAASNAGSRVCVVKQRARHARCARHCQKTRAIAGHTAQTCVRACAHREAIKQKIHTHHRKTRVPSYMYVESVRMCERACARAHCDIFK